MSKYVMTPWRKDLSLIYYLELGLRLLHKCEIQAPLSNDAKSAMRRFQYWRLVLMSKTPHNYRLRWVHLRLSSTDPPTVAEAVWTRAKFLNETDRTGEGGGVCGLNCHSTFTSSSPSQFPRWPTSQQATQAHGTGRRSRVVRLPTMMPVARSTVE
eukprot:GHVU01056348.1.p2 GENE.GHVU01056348.1~~GHVU01056348.1.p2  ORF type:complete len:155 (-),score=10.12 GHVU01056348.1:1924-2388(-)